MKRRIFRGLSCRTTAFLLTLGISLFIGAPTFAQNKPTNGITAQAKAEPIAYYADSFEKVWQTVRDRFWDKNLNGVDWRKIGAAYRARLPEVKTKAQFAELVNAMLEELHASHTEYMTDEDFGFYMFPAVLSTDFEKHRVTHIGVMGHSVKGEFTVSAVLDGGPADKAGLHSGDVILNVEGQPLTTAGSFRGRQGKEVSLTVRREGVAAPLTLKVTPVRENPLTAFLRATEKSAKVLTVGGKRVGYLHLWTMANERFRELLEKTVLDKLSDTDGLILDLRDGYGGSPFGYANVFFSPDVVWEQSGRDGKTDRHTGYDRPMVVLTNGGTRSAKEFFTYQFKKAKRATIIGTKTTGAFLGANGFPINEDGYLELAVVGLKVDGKRLEGAGVTPDIEVLPRASYLPEDAQRVRAEQVVLDAIRLLPERSKKGREVILH